jgi:hypothetical protein
MANPVEIFGDVISGEGVKELLQTIEKISKSFDDLLKNVSDQSDQYAKSMEKIIKKTDELSKSVKSLDVNTEEGAKEIAESNKAAKDLSKTYNSLNSQMQELDSTQERLTQEQNEYNKKAEETIKVDKEREKLIKRLANKELRENAKATLGVVKQQSEFSKNQSRLTQLLEQNTGALGGATNAAKAFGAQLKLLAKNPLVLILTTIVGLLGLVFEAFKKTVGGAETLEKVTESLSATWGTLISQIGKLVSGEIGIIDFFTKTGDAIRKNIEAAQRLVELRRLLANENADLTVEESKYAIAVADLQGIVSNNTIGLRKKLKASQELIPVLNDLAQIRFDRIQNDIAEATAELEKLGIESIFTQSAIDSFDLSEIRRQATLIGDDAVKQVNKISELIAAQTQLQVQNIQESNSALQEQSDIKLEIFESELDFLFDVSDRQKTVNEQRATQIKDLKEQKKLFEENELIIDSTYSAIIGKFEELFNVQLDQERLFNSTAEEVTEYTQELDLAANAANRLRELVIEQIQANSDNSLALEEVNKKLRQQELLQQAIAASARDIPPIIPPESIAPIITTQEELSKLQQIGLGVKTFFENVFGTSVEEVFTRIGNTILDVFSTIDQALAIGEQRRIEASEREIERLEEQQQRQLEIAGENAEAELAIQQRFNSQIEAEERKIAQERRKQAEREKAAAITQSIIQTAIAVTRALGSAAPPANFILAGLVGSLGAAQTAIIAAQPIPQFFKGTDNAPPGPKIVGEKGRELIVTPKGKTFLTGNKAELRTDIPEGSQILTNAITENILRNSGAVIDRNETTAKKIRDISRDEKYGAIQQAIVHSLKGSNDTIEKTLAHSLSNLQIDQFMFEKGEFRHHIKKGNTTLKNVGNENRYKR